MLSGGNDASSGTVFDFAGHVHVETVAPDELTQLNEFVGEHHTDVEALFRWYEQAGVDGAALSQPFFAGHGDTNAVAAANDALLERLKDRPKFHGLAAIPTAAGGEAAASEFERSLNNGYNGGIVETKSAGVELVDETLEPVLEVANREEVPLLVHPKLNDSLHPDVLDDRYRLNAIFGREVALCESLCKVVHDGVLDRYPNLTLVYHHCAGNIASTIGRVRGQLEPGRWPGQSDVLNDEAFEAQLREHVYVDTSGFYGDTRPIQAALDVFPPSNVLFGTDTPYEPRTPEEYRAYVSTVREACAESSVERVLHGNARELL